VKRIAAGAGVSGFARNEDGSFLIAGSSGSATTIGPDDPVPIKLTSKIDDQDFFVAKLTADGAVVWAKSGGGTDSDAATDAAQSPDGSVFLAGRFKGIATFGKGEAKETTLTAPSVDATFVAKLGPDGALAWVKPIAGLGTSTSYPGGVFAAPDGTFRVWGSLRDSITFGKGEPLETTLTSVANDYYFAKYDASGALVGAKRLQGLPTSPRAAMNAAGDVLFFATSGGTLYKTVLAPGEAGERVLTESGMLFARYDSSGTPVDVFLTSGAAGSDLVWSPDGGWTVIGTLCPTTPSPTSTTFGKGEPTEATFTCGTPLMYIARYTKDGKLVWAKKAGDNGHVRGLRLGVPSDGTVRVYGTYGASEYPTFGLGEPGAMKLPASACVGTNCNIPLLGDFESSGTFAFVKRLSADNPEVTAMAVAPTGGITLLGRAGKAKFGEGEPTETLFTPIVGFSTTFLARYDLCP
jgi:hypothetical protein